MIILILEVLIIKSLYKMERKKFTIGVLSGICLTLFLFITIGSTTINYGDGIGRYQISTTSVGEQEDTYVYEIIIDTKNGNVHSRKKTRRSNFVHN